MKAISARGFATQFNSRMLTMIDGRLAQLPGSGLPQATLAPVSGLDMKAVQVVIGPASALYGPNAHTGVVNVAEQWIRYILITGGNWRAPIRDFRLVVDKGRPDNLVSFCGEGVRRISPTQFEMRRRNWRPTRDLDVLILVPSRESD